MDLLSLPTTIVSAVLGNIGRLTDWVHLDTAYCHHHHRAIWLELLASKQLTVHCPVDVSNHEEFTWVSARDARCSSLRFTADINGFKDVCNFLRTKGGSVRTVHFHSGTKVPEMILVALHCQNLMTVEISSLNVTYAFREVLLRNPNIQNIRCVKVTCMEEDIFAGVSLHKLRTMVVEKSNCLKGFPWHETARSESLHTVLWYCSFYGSNFISLLTNCPQIRSFSAEQVKLSFRFVGSGSFLYGVSIQNMSFVGNSKLTDQDLLSIVTNLTSLRSLNIQKCATLTDASLKHLAEYAGERLEVLYVDIKHPESAQTEPILELFGQKCTKLKYLNVNCGEKVLCLGKGTSALVCGCPQLQTLVVNNQSTISPSSRAMVVKFRPELNILVHNENTAFDILSLPIS